MKARSAAQNRYRWGVVVKSYQEWLNLSIDKHNAENGTCVPHLSPNDANFYIKEVVWGLIKRKKMSFGIITVELPLKGASTHKFEERMEQARAHAAQELKFEIALPHEDIRDLEEQYSDNLDRD